MMMMVTMMLEVQIVTMSSLALYFPCMYDDDDDIHNHNDIQSLLPLFPSIEIDLTDGLSEI